MRSSPLGGWSLALGLLPYATVVAFGAIALMITNGSLSLEPPKTPPPPERLSQWRLAALIALALLVPAALASAITGALSLRWHRSLAGGIGLILGATFLVQVAALLVPPLWQFLLGFPLPSRAVSVAQVLVPNLVLVTIIVGIGLMVWRLGREKV